MNKNAEKTTSVGTEWSKVNDFQFFMDASSKLLKGRNSNPESLTSEYAMEYFRRLLAQRFDPRQLTTSQIIYKHEAWIEVSFDKTAYDDYMKPTAEYLDEKGNVDEEAWGLRLMDADFDQTWEPYFTVSLPNHENLYAAFSDSKLYKELLMAAEKDVNAKREEDKRTCRGEFIQLLKDLLQELPDKETRSATWHSVLHNTLTGALGKAERKHVPKQETKNYIYLLVRMAQSCGFRPEKGQAFSQLVSDMLGLDFETADDYVKRACYDDLSQLWKYEETQIERIIDIYDMIDGSWAVDNADAKHFKKMIADDLPILSRPLAIPDEHIKQRYYELAPTEIK